MTTTSIHTSRRRATFDPFQPVWRILASVRFAVFFIGTLAAFGLAGVLIPQVPEAMRGNDAAVDAWVETQRGNFGPLTGVMDRAGLFEVFHARWFVFALGFLAINVTVCVFNRWAPTFRNVFHPPQTVPDSFFGNAHNRTGFAPVSRATAETALRSMRFRLKSREQDGATYIFADRFAFTQLATFASHLALILFIAGGLVTSLTGFTADRFAAEGTTVPVFAVKHPQQLQIRIDDAVGVYGEKGNPLDFRTHLTIFRNGEEVKSGVITVNDPLKFDGYKFHQVAFFPFGAELRIRDLATGNTVLHETFPLEDTTAAPAVTISDASGAELLSDVFPPTIFDDNASGTFVRVPGAGAAGDRILSIGLTTNADDDWQLVAYDPASGDSGAGVRVAEGATETLAGLTLRFDRVEGLPTAVGIDVPGLSEETLTELVAAPGGGKALLLVSAERPAILLNEGAAVTNGGYEYSFEGSREFTGVSVKRDRGAWFIWIATGMLVISLAITFYIPRRRLWLKLTPDATHVAALAEKSGGFEKDMRTLARRMGVETPPGMEEET